MHGPIAAAVAAATLAGCSPVPYYSEVKAVADAGIVIAVRDRQEFNDKKLEVNLAALCDSSIGAVNRHPDPSVRDFVDRLCGGDGQAVPIGRLGELLRMLEEMRPAGS